MRCRCRPGLVAAGGVSQSGRRGGEESGMIRVGLSQGADERGGTVVEATDLSAGWECGLGWGGGAAGGCGVSD